MRYLDVLKKKKNSKKNHTKSECLKEGLHCAVLLGIHALLETPPLGCWQGWVLPAPVTSSHCKQGCTVTPAVTQTPPQDPPQQL